jgi:hypothetical protein
MAIMKDHMHSFIQDLIQNNQEIFVMDDFKECQEAAADIGEMIQNLEATEVKFRRKLSNIAAQHPPDKEKIIYLQGMVDGMNLAVNQWKSIN